MKYAMLSPEDEQCFLRALDRIWSDVGPDCLTGVAEEKGLKYKRTAYGTLMPNEQVNVARSTVVCIVTDQFAQRCPDGVDNETWKRIRKWMFDTPSSVVDKVAAKQFPEKQFGM